jgi:hypothetical protein
MIRLVLRALKHAGRALLCSLVGSLGAFWTIQRLAITAGGLAR